MSVVACSAPGIYGRTERTCFACGQTGLHISEWLGVGYGYDHHCVSCRVTDQDGHLEQPTPETTAHWNQVAERCVLPTYLFDAYVHADTFFSTPACNSILAEQRGVRRLRAARAAIDEHLASA